MSEYSKGRYEARKANGLCTDCGKPIGTSSIILCDSCRDKRNEHKRRLRLKNVENLKKKSNRFVRDGLSIEQINRLAIKNGVSYGQMVAILDGCTALRTVFH